MRKGTTKTTLPALLRPGHATPAATARRMLGLQLPLLIAAWCCPFACGQQSATQEQVVRDPGAVALLQRSWTQMGGPAWETAGSVQLSGILDIYRGKPQNGKFTFSTNSSGEASATMTDDTGTTSSYSLNGSSLTVSISGKPAQSLPFHKVLNMPSYFPLAVAGKALADPTWSIIPHGTATINSATCTEVEIKRIYPLSIDKTQILSKLTERYLCIDAQSNLIDRVRYTSYSNTNIRISRQRTLDYTDYRQFGIYLLPSSITDSVDGQVIQHVTITSASAMP